jgi:N-acetylmuramoyl-L-alanine amidase
MMEKMAKIGIDAGHGGIDRSNVGPAGYIEADGALEMALVCRDELIRAGYTVVMTRETDQTLSLAERADIFNQAGVDLAVSIHTNASKEPRVRGIETIHSIHGGPGQGLAAVIANRLQIDLNLPLRRVFSRESETKPGKDYYGIIRLTRMPCVIVEVEFHSNPDAERLLKEDWFRQKAGVSIAQGIMSFMEGMKC